MSEGSQTLVPAHGGTGRGRIRKQYGLNSKKDFLKKSKVAYRVRE